MREPENTPFPHTPECKTPDATPEWIPMGKGSFERICTCHREVVHWQQRQRRPDPLDPRRQRHTRDCRLLTIDGIADKPEIYEAYVTLKVETDYTFATCNSCGLNWYTYDDQLEKVAAGR